MPTILCIDDDVNFLELEKSILETNGYAVLISSDGPNGITLASNSPIDAVVLAFNMPGMDAGQVAEALVQSQPDLPLVICTGLFDLVPEALKWFAAACVDKRDGSDVFLSAIQGVITKRVMGQAVAG